jgi:hypothetical protein
MDFEMSILQADPWLVPTKWASRLGCHAEYCCEKALACFS